MRYMLVMLMLAGWCFAATGDILSVTIPNTTASTLTTDGWFCDVVVEGLSTGGTYDFGFGSSAGQPVKAGAKFIMTVTSLGFDSSGNATTIQRTVYGTRVVQKPYPNHATAWETAGGGNVTLRVALSEYVYAKDDTGAGNSGTAPTVSISAGWYTQNSTPSNACTNLTVTNDSELAYPKALAKWDNVAGAMNADRVTSAFKLAATAFHAYNIACVKFTATGVTSTNSVTQTVSTTQTEAYVTGIYREFYRTSDIALTGFTEHEQVNVNFVAYPKVGDSDSVCDTTGRTTLANEWLGYNQVQLTVDSDNSLTVYAVVDATNGNNSTGAASATLATAEASPFLTLRDALEANPTIVYLKAGTHKLYSAITGTAESNKFWWRIMPHPSATRDTAILDLEFTSSVWQNTFKLARTSLENITIKSATGGSLFFESNTTNSGRFRNCNFAHNNLALNSGTCLGYASAVNYFQNCVGDLNLSQWRLNSGTGYCNQIHEGNYLSGIYGLNCAIMVGCILQDNARFLPSAGMTAEMGCFVCNNIVIRSNDAVDVVALKAGASNCVIANNVAGQTDDAVGGSSSVSLFSNTAGMTNILLFCNIIVADRWLFAYTEGTGNVLHTKLFVKGNVATAYNCKSDVFANNGTRTGNWAMKYATGYIGNFFTKDSDNDGDGVGIGGSFNLMFAGIDSIWGISCNPAKSITVVKDTSKVGTGTGQTEIGDYRPTTDSTHKSLMPTSSCPFRYDILGNLRRGDLTAAGPYVYVTQATVNRNTPMGGGNMLGDSSSRPTPMGSGTPMGGN